MFWMVRSAYRTIILPRALLVLTAYLDETGQEQDDWMFIAGFMGDDVAWREFPDLWAEAIGPQRKHLHMKSLRFSKMPVKKMLERAALVPKECGLIPILAGARLRDYADMLHQEEDSVIHAAYMMCCRGDCHLCDEIHTCKRATRDCSGASRSVRMVCG